jgi:hypothetical protein
VDWRGLADAVITLTVLLVIALLLVFVIGHGLS